MASDTAAGGGTSGADEDAPQSFDVAALRAGVKLQPGGTIKISVRGVSGKPRPGGRKPVYITGAGGGSGADGGSAGSDAGGVSGAGDGSDAGQDVYVVSLTLQAIGGTNLSGETVQIIDPETGKPVGDPITADADGNVRAQVPDGKDYVLRVVDEEAGGLPIDGHDIPDPLSILVRFSDTDGNPKKGLAVKLTEDAGSVDLVTDDAGELRIPTTAGVATLAANGQTFLAHPVLVTEPADQSHYRFVILS